MSTRSLAEVQELCPLPSVMSAGHTRARRAAGDRLGARAAPSPASSSLRHVSHFCILACALGATQQSWARVRINRQFQAEDIVHGRQQLQSTNSLHWGLSPGPSVHRSDALPLNYRGPHFITKFHIREVVTPNLGVRCPPAFPRSFRSSRCPL